MAEPFDPYYRWLAIPPKDQPPHHYRLLGLELFESDPVVIEMAADRQMTYVRTFQTGRFSDVSQKLLNEIAAAKVMLLDSGRRATYDDALRSSLEPAAPAAAPAATPPPMPAASPPPIGMASFGGVPPMPGFPPPAPPMPMPTAALAPMSPVAAPPAPARPVARPRPVVNEDGEVETPFWREPSTLVSMGVMTVALVTVLAFVLFSGKDDHLKAVTEAPTINGDTAMTDPTLTTEDTTPPSEPTPPPSAPSTPPTPSAPTPPRTPVSTPPKPPVQVAKVEPPVTPATSPVAPSVPATPSPSPPATTPTVTPPKTEPKPSSPATPPAPPVSPLASGPIDLLKRIDPRRDSYRGKWEMESDVLISPGSLRARLEIPFTPPEEYQLTLVVERRSGGNLFGIGLLVEGRQVVVRLEQDLCGLHRVDDLPGDKNPTTRSGPALLNDGPNTIVCTVRRGRVRVVSNDFPLLDWTGESKRLSVDDDWSVADKTRLFLGAWDGEYAISKVEIAAPPAASDTTMPTTVATTPAEPPKKLPVPSPQALDEALRKSTDLVAIEQAKKPADKAALAQTLYDRTRSDREMEPAPRYVLLEQSQKLASAGGDVALAMKAIRELRKKFELDPSVAREMERRAVVESARTVVVVSKRKAVVTEAQNLVKQAIADERFDIASEMQDIATAAASRTQDSELVIRTRAHASDLKDFTKMWQDARGAEKILADKPDDPDANLKVGRYRCVVQRDLAGLENLAKGSDRSIRAAAELDLTMPMTTDDQMKVGDSWWNLGESTLPPSRLLYMERALYWYGLALPNVAPNVKSRLDHCADVYRKLKGPDN